MNDFSPMMMFKPLQPSILRSHSESPYCSDPHISIMGCSHSSLGVYDFMSIWGGVMCSYSYVPVFDYRVLAQSIADNIDRDILNDMFLIAGIGQDG